MGYPTLQLSMAEIEAIEKAAQVAYNNGGARLDSQEYLMVNALCDRWWARYEPEDDKWEMPDASHRED